MNPTRKVIYAAFNRDPTDPDSSSGALYFCYQSLVEAGYDVRVCGPFSAPPVWAERLLRQLYVTATRKRYTKYQVSRVWRAARALRAMDREWRPDAVVSIYPACLAFYDGAARCVFDQDVNFIDYERNYPEYGRLAQRWSVMLERRTFARSDRVVTHSARARESLIADYGVSPDRIDVFPYPPVLPLAGWDSVTDAQRAPLELPLRLLLVGRDFRRKGVDIALEVAGLLNARGLPAELTVCGVPGPAAPGVTYAGLFRKTVPEELQGYLALYGQAHLLLHPTRFDPSPLVCSEAAAFGIPTITNGTGGMATTVAHGISGIVLPKDSPAGAYAGAIASLWEDPRRLAELRASTRRRYENDLNWQVNAKRFATSVLQALSGPPVRRG